jgi:hypothetical protein
MATKINRIISHKERLELNSALKEWHGSIGACRTKFLAFLKDNPQRKGAKEFAEVLELSKLEMNYNILTARFRPHWKSGKYNIWTLESVINDDDLLKMFRVNKKAANEKAAAEKVAPAKAA